MNHRIFILIVGLMLPLLGSTQGADYAGENTTACQGAGAMIGNAGVTDVCYTWEPADGLNESDLHSQSPIVHPQHTTEYTVHVTGTNYSFSATDRVKVTVDFGGLVITPSYIDLSGPLTEQAQAVLTINDFQGSSSDISWSILNAGTTGCVISSEGVISNCSQSGTVKVRATNEEFPGCYAEKDLEINGGIKDVTATDIANPDRVAHHDGTLYLVGSAAAKITATPNDDSSFPSGQPEWMGPYTPPAGGVTFNTPALEPGTYEFEAGVIDPKQISVIDLGEDATTLQFSLESQLLLDMLNLMKGNTVEKDLDPFCSPPLDFDLNAFASMKASYKSSNAIKYKDPGYDEKLEVSIEIPALAFEGCMFFPCCSGGANFGVASAFYFTYFKAGLGLSISAAGAKDPSTATPDWAFTSLSGAVSGNLEAGLRLEVNVPSGFGALGQANLSTEAKLECRYSPSPDKIEWNASWGGLVGKVSLGIWYLSMDNIIEVSKQKNFINGREVGWKTLYTFPD